MADAMGSTEGNRASGRGWRRLRRWHRFPGRGVLPRLPDACLLPANHGGSGGVCAETSRAQREMGGGHEGKLGGRSGPRAGGRVPVHAHLVVCQLLPAVAKVDCRAARTDFSIAARRIRRCTVAIRQRATARPGLARDRLLGIAFADLCCGRRLRSCARRLRVGDTGLAVFQGTEKRHGHRRHDKDRGYLEETRAHGRWRAACRVPR